MEMKKHSWTNGIMGVCAAMLISTTAVAQAVDVVDDLILPPFKWYYDYKTFNGSTCQPTYGTQAADFNAYTTGIYNGSNGTRSVTCPIMRDDTETKGGAGVTAYLNNAKGTSCTVYSLDPHGATVAWQNKVVAASGKQTLNFWLNKSVAMGNYVMYCRLTSKGYVSSYKLKERYTDLNRRTDKDASFPIWPIPIPVPPVIKSP